ncbi:MAG: hydroxyacid dehydrogenase [Eubacterium sp.]|nr:hydroxyacid dehydrogenase [Eubacterium sp.]
MNILLTGAWKNAKEYIDKIEEMGHQVKFLQFEKDALPCDYEWVEGCVCNGLFLHHKMNLFKNLKWVQITSAGSDRVPMDYAKEQGIQVNAARGVYSVPIAEHVLMCVLTLLRQYTFFSKNQEQRIWEKNRSLKELAGMTVGIVGCGSVGMECAKRFKGFDVKLVGFDVECRETDVLDEMIEMKEFSKRIHELDIIVLTVPLVSVTVHLINGDTITQMKDGVILVNVSRGGVVDTKALIANKEKFSGIILDVFEEEPLESDSSLWTMENVIITPHNSFVGDGNDKRLDDVVVEGILRLIKDEMNN